MNKYLYILRLLSKKDNRNWNVGIVNRNKGKTSASLWYMSELHMRGNRANSKDQNNYFLKVSPMRHLVLRSTPSSEHRHHHSTVYRPSQAPH
jgi:hypothetical protein